MINDATNRRQWLRPLVIVLLGAAALTGSLQADDQESCNLDQAREDYRFGRFEQALEMLRACSRQERLSYEEEVEIEDLLAKTFLATDQVEEADDAVTRLLILSPGYSPRADDPPLFIQAVRRAREQTSDMLISSVSKNAESLRMAPATVIVITADEIERRGYLDLEALFHDLPGFDISRGNGVLYSNIYPRGYRSNGNDRMLVMIDGVEENDLWSNIVYLSRQHPLSCIDRVEVIYGPASTMYGANAFVGVVNIVTREPQQSLDEGELISVRALAGAGSWSTRYLDVSVTGRSRRPNLLYSLTVRGYHSDEPDLSGYPDWDYDPSYFGSLDYTSILGESATQAEAAEAMRLDQEAYVGTDGRPLSFSDITDDWYVAGKVRFADLTIGFQTWRREEGSSSWYTDSYRAAADEGTLWVPKQHSVFIKYEKQLGSGWGLTLLSRFKKHRLDDDTAIHTFCSYANGCLDLEDLRGESDPAVEGYSHPVEPGWKKTAYRVSSSQFRNELTLHYTPSPRLRLVTGLDTRHSTLQGDYVKAKIEENGVPVETPDFGATEYFNQLDVGVFAQVSWDLDERLRLVAGGRLDHNDVVDGAGYGSVFNPRLAAIYRRGSWLFKAIYAEAFKDASNYDRYATVANLREIPNPALEPEKVANLELAASWLPHDGLSLELAAYRASYSNGVVTRDNMNQNLGSILIQGVQANLQWQHDSYDLYANYTFTDPLNTTPMDNLGARREDVSQLRIPDIASHQISLGVNARYWDRLNLNLRLNYVGDRKRMCLDYRHDPAQECPNNLIGSFVAVNTAITYENLLPGLNLQLLFNNLLDEDYYHPGVRAADGRQFVTQLPQSGRSIFLRLAYIH
jgi:outer membrane receptor protein involved in Fe transport